MINDLYQTCRQSVQQRGNRITYPFANVPDKSFIVRQAAVQCLVQGILLPLVISGILGMQKLDRF